MKAYTLLFASGAIAGRVARDAFDNSPMAGVILNNINFTQGVRANVLTPTYIEDSTPEGLSYIDTGIDIGEYCNGAAIRGGVYSNSTGAWAYAGWLDDNQIYKFLDLKVMYGDVLDIDVQISSPTSGTVGITNVRTKKQVFTNFKDEKVALCMSIPTFGAYSGPLTPNFFAFDGVTISNGKVFTPSGTVSFAKGGKLVGDGGVTDCEFDGENLNCKVPKN